MHKLVTDDDDDDDDDDNNNNNKYVTALYQLHSYVRLTC